ncbi:MAG: BatD family protein, partial [Methyloprofundus sp.]
MSIDRNPVNLQESFQLTFTASYDPDGEPDFSPLDKDFEILNQSQQQSVQIINWEKTKSIQWILIVMAKHTGKLVIPAINFGNDSSQFAAIVVNDSSQVNNTNEDLFLQVEVSTTEPYIQQQVIYTLKLFRKVNIAQASLTEPELADALIEKLSEDTNYNTQFQGENYVVTKRKYAIFPQKSGIATITPLSLTAGV